MYEPTSFCGSFNHWIERVQIWDTSSLMLKRQLLKWSEIICLLFVALLKTVAANKDAALPLKLFEVSDVILVDASSETGCRNERRLAAVHCSTKTEFEVIHGLLNRVMEVLGVPLEGMSPRFTAFWCSLRSTAYNFLSFKWPNKRDVIFVDILIFSSSVMSASNSA